MEDFTDVVYFTSDDELKNEPKRVFLVTLSKLDHRIFSLRQNFGGAVVQAFGANNVLFFVASKEQHETSGEYHYHVAIKLKTPCRWMKPKKFLKENFGVVCNFAVSNSLYAGAYRYATKVDIHYFTGNVLEKHPNLDVISKTYERATVANTTYRENSRKRKDSKDSAANNGGKSKKRTRAEFRADLGMFIVQNNIKKEIQLIALARDRLANGDRKLFDFLFNMKKKDREELVADAWRFENAGLILHDENVVVIKRLQETNSPCVCNGEWMWCAQDLFLRNNVNIHAYAEALRQCLTVGRRKHNNLMLVGPASSGKTFLLKPLLTLIPTVFSNPPGSQFGWMGAEHSNLIFLNDLRWKPPGPPHGGNIAWHAFLNLLEDFEVTLPAAMNVQSQHVVMKKLVPIVATSITPITFFMNNSQEPQTARHVNENKMMSERWVVFEFIHTIPEKEQKNIPECGACFKELLFQS